MRKAGRLTAGMLFSFLLAGMLLPGQAYAAEQPLTKEITITADSEDDYKKQAGEAFAEELTEDGKRYTLTDIKCEVIDTEYLEKLEKTVDVKGEPDETYTADDGTVYTLVRAEEKEQETAEPQVVTAYENYDHPVSRADVPGTKQVTAVNELTGEEETVACALTGITKTGTSSVNSVMTVTFANYDAAYYLWNGHYIARDDQTPPLAGYEEELLAYCGAQSGSRITGYSWSGEPYTVDGVMYRDAAATVQQTVQMYRADYAGQLSVPETEPEYTAVYTTPDTEGDVRLTVVATAAYAEKAVPVFHVVVTAVIIGLILALIFLLLFLYAKRKRKKEERKGD